MPPILKLTKTESLIVEALRAGPKNKYELEELVDHAKEYSESFIKVIIANINTKKRIIEGYYEGGFYKYRLIEEQVEYQLAKGIEAILMEIQELRSHDVQLACKTCSFRANYEIRWRVQMMLWLVIVIFLCIFSYFAYNWGYERGRNDQSAVVNIDCDALFGTGKVVK